MPAITFNEILKAEQTPTGCGVLVLRDGKILAGSRIERAGKGKLCGPGGHIEPGETPEEGARREAYEEFGIVCNELVPLGVQTGRGSHGRSAVFLCSDFTGDPKTDEVEMTEPQWIRPEEIAEEDAYPPFFQSLELLPLAKSFNEVLKFNPYHGYHGYFSSASGATSFTFQTRDPSKQHLADNAKLKEQNRVRMAAIHGVEDKIRNQKFESAAVIDKNGNQVFFKDGAKSQVQFTPDEVASMKGASLTHNHPSGSMFSNEDIGLMVGADLNEIRATTASGKTFSLSRGEGYTDDLGVAFYNEHAKQRNLAIQKAGAQMDAEGFQEKVLSGKVTQEAANKEYNKRVTEIMTEWASKHAGEYNMRFAVESR